MNKQQLASKITEMEGLTDEERQELLRLLHEQKKYGLVWEDKPEAVEAQLEECLPVLTEVKERALISQDPEAPNHIIIEGDNLEALTTLSFTHAGKIDVIYIDPPYNTGNNDFVYNDKFVDKEDAYRHSKWLSFMNKRLRIAKQLLSDKGVIFISIDDNEQSQLKLLCDEIFGEYNFVGTYFWKKTSTPPALSYKIRRKFEFVLCFQKSDIFQRKFAQGYIDGGDVPLLNTGNPIGILRFPAKCVRFGIKDGIYSAREGNKINLLDDVIVKDGFNDNAFRASAHFKWSQENLEKEIKAGTYFLIKSKSFSPRFQKNIKSTKVPSNIIDKDEVNVGTNEDAQKELECLNVTFGYPKPSSLIAYLIKMPFWEENDITILDFFAGSGTTLHATMQLNKEDGGKRTCILVTNNENKICEEVTYERNKRVIVGYTTPKHEVVEGLHSNSLRYYRTELLPREKNLRNMRQLMDKSTDLLCVRNDVYTELPLPGLGISGKYARYFENNKTKMLVIYKEEAIVDYIVPALSTLPESDGKIMVYVFSPSGDPFASDFEEVEDKVQLCPLPKAIYEAYRHVLPKRKYKIEAAANKETNPQQ